MSTSNPPSSHQRGMIIVNTQQPQLLQAGSETGVRRVSEVQLRRLQVQRQTWVMKRKEEESLNKHSLSQRREVLAPTQKALNHFWEYVPVLLVPLLADFAVELWLPVASRWLASFQIHCLQKPAHRRITENTNSLVVVSRYWSCRTFIEDLIVSTQPFFNKNSTALQDSSDLITWRSLILRPTAKATIGVSEKCPFLKVRLKFALRLFNLGSPVREAL